MKFIRNFTAGVTLFLAIFSGAAFAASGHDMAGHDQDGKGRFGTLFHESKQDGYMLSYYLMDLRENDKTDGHTGQMAGKEMDKPHHIMVYIMDKDHKMVEKAKVGFMIKGGDKETQKAMGMAMSKGFGTTADMKAKGTYTIITKVVVNGSTLMDKFDHEMK